MPEWLFGGLVTLCVGIIGTAGLVIGYIISARTARATAQATTKTATITAAATVDANARNDTQTLVDQLQEELARHRSAQDARATAQDERLNRLETYSDGYRNHAHELRAHIWDGNPPPPPEWPKDLPR